jgi:hypothetical protein
MMQGMRSVNSRDSLSSIFTIIGDSGNKNSNSGRKRKWTWALFTLSLDFPSCLQWTHFPFHPRSSSFPFCKFPHLLLGAWYIVSAQ